MFKNMGGKIKGWTKFVCWIGIIISILAGVGMAIAGMQSSDGAAAIVGGISMAVVGSLISWISSFVAYGFGEMVENSTIQAALMLKAEAERGNAPMRTEVVSVPAQARSNNDDNANDLSNLEDSIKF